MYTRKHKCLVMSFHAFSVLLMLLLLIYSYVFFDMYTTSDSRHSCPSVYLCLDTFIILIVQKLLVHNTLCVHNYSYLQETTETINIDD